MKVKITYTEAPLVEVRPAEAVRYAVKSTFKPHTNDRFVFLEHEYDALLALVGRLFECCVDNNLLRCEHIAQVLGGSVRVSLPNEEVIADPANTVVCDDCHDFSTHESDFADKGWRRYETGDYSRDQCPECQKRETATMPVTYWRHVERGTEYRVLDHAELQVDDAHDFCGDTLDGIKLVIYQSTDDEERIYARPLAEFCDGRFVKIQPAYRQRSPDAGPALDFIPGALCSVCRSPQFNTPGGVSCHNGHGGAPRAED